MGLGRAFCGATFICALLQTIPAGAMSLQQAVERAVTTNPRVLEAAANRRSIDQELGQSYGAYLPTVDLNGGIGPQFIDRPESLDSDTNRAWRSSRDVGVSANFTFFDGFARANETYRQGARVDGAAARVMERAELVGLDAIETFLDVNRHLRILAAADENVRIHRELLSRVRSRVEGGSSTEGELRQAEERVAAVLAGRADILSELGAARARFENVIGVAPGSLGRVSRPKGMPGSQGQAIAAARANHPSLQAGASDVDAADAEYDKTKSLFLPTLGVQGRASLGEDLDGTPGLNNEFAVRFSMSWNLFNGGIDVKRKRQQAERVTESRMRLDQLRRTVDETVRRSWSDITSNDVRIAALRQQTTASEAVIVNYNREFEAGLRDLLDLLIAQNSAFTGQVQLISAETIAVFARYRLLASTGQLLSSMDISPPPEAVDAPPPKPWFVGGTAIIEPLRKW